MSAILLVAFSCKPQSGSEWGVGWNYLRMMSMLFGRVTLVTRDAEGQIEEIEKRLKEQRIENVHIFPVKDLWFYQAVFRRKNIHLRFLTIYYHFWIWKVLGFLIKRKLWKTHDYILQATWVSDWVFNPSLLLPFKYSIAGPLGSQPANFSSHSRDFLASHIRFFCKLLLRVCFPNWVIALKAHAAIGIARASLERFPWNLCANKMIVSPVYNELKKPIGRMPDKCLLFVGKHLPFKNIDLFLAVADRMLKLDADLSVHLLGDHFNAESRLSSWARASSRRFFVHGVVSFDVVSKFFGEKNSVLYQPTSELGGTVGVEAISLGAPVVCARGFGLDAFFDEGSYPFAVPYFNREQFIEDSITQIFEIFEKYDFASKSVLGFSEKFSIEANAALLKKLIFRDEEN